MGDDFGIWQKFLRLLGLYGGEVILDVVLEVIFGMLMGELFVEQFFGSD